MNSGNTSKYHCFTALLFDGDRYSEKSEEQDTNSSVNGMARRPESYIEKYTWDGDVAASRESRSDIFPWSQCTCCTVPCR
jgi:hypothetical protein